MPYPHLPDRQGLILLLLPPLGQAPGHLCQALPTPRPLPKLDGRNPAPSPSGPRWSKPAASHGPARRRWAAAQTRGSARSGCGRRPRSWELGSGPAAVAATATPSRRGAEETQARESLGARRGGRGRRPLGGGPGPAARSPPGIRLKEPGEPGSPDPKELVSWWWGCRDPGATRKEI